MISQHRFIVLIRPFFFLFFLLSSSQVLPQSTMDSPHNLLNAGCIHCHDFTAWAQPNMIPNLGGGTIEEEYESLCIVCHTGSGLPEEGRFMTGHSSVTTSPKYHNGSWSVGCSVCHNQHVQPIDKVVGNNGGFIRNKIDLRRIVIEGSGNVKPGLKKIKLLATTGPNSFADGDEIIDGICEVCHTLTNHWRNDGSLAGLGAHTGLEGSNCTTTCHPHDQGFQVKCDECHDFPPGTLVFDPPEGTGSITPGAHALHITKNYPCQSCHKDSVGNNPSHNNGDKAITLGFSLFNSTYEGGTYNGQALPNYNTTTTVPATLVTNTGTKTCENIYCHGRMPNGSLWGGGINTTPVWDGSVSCGDCHRASAASPPSSGQHSKHARENNAGYNYSCSLCHKNPTVDGSLHGNNQSEVIFSSDPMTKGGTYTGDTDMLGSYGTCENIYCHSTVQSSPPGSGPVYRTSPLWNGSISTCDKCHYTFGSTPGLTSGSHASHLFNYETQQCYSCHNWEGSDDACMSCHDASINPTRSKHANYIVNVEFMPSYGGTYSGTAPPGDSYGNCGNTYCHSTGISVSTGTIPANSSPVWGTTGPLTCDSCHNNPPDYPSYELSTPKANSHDRHNSILNDDPTRTGFSCEICHYQTTTTGTSITDYSNHVNRQYEVSPSPTYPHGSGPSSVDRTNTFDYTYDSGGGTCANISCHNNWGYSSTKRWGGATLTASFSYITYQIGCYGANVFASAPTCNPAGACQPPYTYAWDFGDGTVTEGNASESHDYGTLGSFDITLTTTSATGLTGSKSVTISTSAPPNTQPTIDKSISVAGMTATITDLSVDPDFDFCDHSGPAQVRIDWDDGTVETLSLNLTDVASNQTFSHTYGSAGNKTIKYYIWDNADTWWLTSPNTTITVP